MVKIDAEVLRALIRLLKPGPVYPGLVLAGNKESAEQLTKDVLLVAETLAEIIECEVPHKKRLV